jgi:hypothetical protein
LALRLRTLLDIAYAAWLGGGRLKLTERTWGSCKILKGASRRGSQVPRPVCLTVSSYRTAHVPPRELQKRRYHRIYTMRVSSLCSVILTSFSSTLRSTSIHLSLVLKLNAKCECIGGVGDTSHRLNTSRHSTVSSRLRHEWQNCGAVANLIHLVICIVHRVSVTRS